MRLIDIYDNGGRATAMGQLVSDRLRSIGWRGESVGALMRRGETAMKLSDSPGIDVVTTSFGFGMMLTLPHKLRKLSAGADHLIVHTHSLKVAEQILLASRAMDDIRVSTIIELTSGIAPEKTSHASFVMEGVDMMIFHSAFDRDTFLAPWAEDTGIMEKAIVCPPGVSIPPECKKADDTKELALIWGGEIDSITAPGLSLLIEAMGNCHHIPVKLIVAGQGSAKTTVPLLRKASSLGLKERVEWLGDRALTPADMLRADAAIIPVSDDPGAFLLGATAMAAGLPLLLPDTPRMAELGQDPVNALFFSPGSKESLAEAMTTIAGDPTLRASLGKNARLKAEAQYDLIFSLDRLLMAYLKLLL
ncbi:MAG: glycosyltransferase family 4 protein [Pseudoflavonifractor sp.]|nr:glycosyltransferase family 4 protein [Alloprevotella sp.]MCM1116941.1 glycosyltransferase family 4 protein [Pseudoflavonifractor sp.]